MTKSDDRFLDDMFELARTQSPQPSDALMARVMADATVAQPAAQTQHPQRSLWAGFMDLIGGWPALGGLAAAGVAGIWVGFAPPAAITTWTAELVGTSVSIDLLGDTSDYFSEGLIDG